MFILFNSTQFDSILFKDAKLATLPSLKDLPKLKIWYQRRMTPTEDKTGSFERPDEYELLKRLERIRNTQFTLPTITRGTLSETWGR
jgi:hypothetical protein